MKGEAERAEKHVIYEGIRGLQPLCIGSGQSIILRVTASRRRDPIAVKNTTSATLKPHSLSHTFLAFTPAAIRWGSAPYRPRLCQRWGLQSPA